MELVIAGRWRGGADCRRAGLSTGEELTTGANFHSSRHWEMMFVG